MAKQCDKCKHKANDDSCGKNLSKPEENEDCPEFEDKGKPRTIGARKPDNIVEEEKSKGNSHR